MDEHSVLFPYGSGSSEQEALRILCDRMVRPAGLPGAPTPLCPHLRGISLAE